MHQHIWMFLGSSGWLLKVAEMCKSFTIQRENYLTSLNSPKDFFRQFNSSIENQHVYPKKKSRSHWKVTTIFQGLCQTSWVYQIPSRTGFIFSYFVVDVLLWMSISFKMCNLHLVTPLGFPWELSNSLVSWGLQPIYGDISNQLIKYSNPFKKYRQGIPAGIPHIYDSVGPPPPKPVDTAVAHAHSVPDALTFQIESAPEKRWRQDSCTVSGRNPAGCTKPCK